MTTIRVLALAGLLLPQTASAQEAETGRFQLERSGSGLVRLDTRTGALTLCEDKDGNLICRMAADERAAYEEQLDRLEKRVAALEQKMSSALSAEGKGLPSDAEVDRSIGIMERFMRAFFGLVKEFETEEQAGKEPAGY
jgi:hypothetical protein